MIRQTMPATVIPHERVEPCSQVAGVSLQRFTSSLGDCFVTIEVGGVRTIISPRTHGEAKALLKALGDALGAAMTRAVNAGMSAGMQSGPGSAKAAGDAECSARTSTRTAAASGAKSSRG